MFIGRSKIDCVHCGLSWEVTEFGEAVEEFEMFSKPKFTMEVLIAAPLDVGLPWVLSGDAEFYWL